MTKSLVKGDKLIATIICLSHNDELSLSLAWLDLRLFTTQFSDKVLLDTLESRINILDSIEPILVV